MDLSSSSFFLSSQWAHQMWCVLVDTLKYSRSWFPRQPCLPVQELNAAIPWFEPVEANMYPRIIKYLNVRYNIVKVLVHRNGVLPHWYTNGLNVLRNVTIFVWPLLNKDLDVCDISFCLFELISYIC